jgi:transposase
MKTNTEILPGNTADLEEIIKVQANEILYLKEQIHTLKDYIYGSKSEKIFHPANRAIQLSLFGDNELGNETEEPESNSDEIEIPSHKRKKKTGRKPIPAHFPRIETIHDIDEKDKICACGTRKEVIGKESSERLDFVPAKLQVKKDVQLKYACPSCEGAEDDGPTVAIAPAPKYIIPKGIATPGLIANIIIEKFMDASPFYRQEAKFRRMGIDLKRATMCNWAIKTAQYCYPLLDLFQKEMIKESNLINIDETTFQVLKEPGRSPTQKSYIWVFRGGKQNKPIILFQYHETRSGDAAYIFLQNYSGYVQTDGFSGYNFLDNDPNRKRLDCWAHGRRYFTKASKSGTKKKGNKLTNADIAINFIRKLYAVERSAKDKKLSPDEIYNLRQNESKPILKEFKIWLDQKKGTVPPKSLLGKAFSYVLKRWPSLNMYLDNGYLTIDNNLAENAIRPFVVGRKNWLFSATQDGAHASAAMYSLIETAKANNLDPYAYLRYLFKKLPFVESTHDYKKLLPWNIVPDDLIDEYSIPILDQD